MTEKSIRYIEIAEEIRNKILSSVYPTNHLLPSENQLSKQYNVSRMTIRKVIEILVKENYLYTLPGKGTFVKEFSSNKFKTTMNINDILKEGYDYVKLIKANIIYPDADLVYQLQVKPSEKVVNLKWILYKNERPVALDEKYIPYAPGLNIKEDNINYIDFTQIYNDINIYELKKECTIKGKISDDKINSYLKLDKSQFIAIIEQK